MYPGRVYFTRCVFYKFLVFKVRNTVMVEVYAP